MKKNFFPALFTLSIGIISVMPVPSALAAPKKKPVMRDIITPDQLNARRQEAGETNPFASSKDFKPAEGEDPAKKRPPSDLIGQSDFLCSMGNATLVPKRALLHVPNRLSDRTRLTDKMQIVTWPDFYAKNRTWITTVEVTRQQAEGKVAIDEKKMEQLHQTGDVLIATMGGSPISVLPLQVPDENEDGTVTEKEN